MAMTDAEYCDKLNSLGEGLPGETAMTPASRKSTEWGRSVTAWIVTNPELSLGIAFALGAGIALVVKRR